MQVQAYSYNLPFKYPFTISKGTKTHQPSLVVALSHFGVTGYGEAPAITYYNITVEKMLEDLERKKMMVEKFSFTDPERYWHYLHHLIPANPFLVSALDMAAWDMYGKLKGQRVDQLIEKRIPRLDKEPLCDYTIGIDTVDKMVAKMKEKPWPIYKIKVGTADDIAIVKALRAETDAILRVDANAGWDLATALQLIPQLKELGVEYVEQPLAKDAWDDMKVLYKESSLPLYADEACVFEQDVEKCKDHFHGINIKLTKCSGITPAIRMIKKARELNLKVMMGSMNESTLGSAAIAHFLPFIDEVDMDGPLLLAEDIATGLQYDYGKVTYGNGDGLGIQFENLKI